MATDRTEVLRNGRRVDAWWVSDITDIAGRMADEAGCSMVEAYRLIAQIAEGRADGD